MSRYHWTKCTVNDCNNRMQKSFNPAHNYNGYCKMHLGRFMKHGHINNTRAPNATWRHKDENGYVKIKINGKSKYEHVHLAEKALGKSLPKGAVVHHMNEKRDDNFTYFNLVICPTKGYHSLLHSRMKALNK